MRKAIMIATPTVLHINHRIEGPAEEAQERLSKIDMSILAKAFRGELVAQDPNDEPASVLLDRIS
jgi:type I restriction enzyme S subunit